MRRADAFPRRLGALLACALVLATPLLAHAGDAPADGSRREVPDSDLLVWSASIAVIVDEHEGTRADRETMRSRSIDRGLPRIDGVRVRIRPRSRFGWRELAIREVWAYPTSAP